MCFYVNDCRLGFLCTVYVRVPFKKNLYLTEKSLYVRLKKNFFPCGLEDNVIGSKGSLIIEDPLPFIVSLTPLFDKPQSSWSQGPSRDRERLTHWNLFNDFERLG